MCLSFSRPNGHRNATDINLSRHHSDLTATKKENCIWSNEKLKFSQRKLNQKCYQH